MLRLAIQMLIGKRSKYISLIFGVLFATLLILIQSAMLLGFCQRCYKLVADIPLPDIWIMNPATSNPDMAINISDKWLERVKTIPGVMWAVPLYYGFGHVQLHDGTERLCQIFGVDSQTLIGAPLKMLEGNIADLQRSEGVIIDFRELTNLLAQKRPDGTLIPWKLGDVLQLNKQHSVLVGIAHVSISFTAIPTLFTTFSRIREINPQEQDHTTFILVKANPNQNKEELSREIQQITGLKVFTKQQFSKELVLFYFGSGILMTFGAVVAIGFCIGVFVVAQLLYTFTLENIHLFALLKAMGTAKKTLLQMILLQAFLIGAIGYGIGVGISAALFSFFKHTDTAFYMPWQLIAAGAVAVLGMCWLAATISIYRILKLEPAIVFKS